MTDSAVHELVQLVEKKAAMSAQALDELSRKDEVELYIYLGNLVSQNATGAPSTASFNKKYSRDDLMRGDFDLKTLGINVFKRWNKALHQFLCNSEATDDDSKARLIKAITGKDGNAIALTAGILVASFGLSVPIAAVVSSLVYNIIFKPAGEELCAFWQTKL